MQDYGGKRAIDIQSCLFYLWPLLMKGDLMSQFCRDSLSLNLLTYGNCGRLNNVPQRYACPNPQNPWACVFKDVIILRTLRWRDYLVWSGWAQCNQKTTFGRQAGRSVLAEGDVITKHEVGGMQEKARATECRQFLEANKVKRTDSALRASTKSQPCQYLEFSQWNWANFGLLISGTMRYYICSILSH